MQPSTDVLYFLSVALILRDSKSVQILLPTIINITNNHSSITDNETNKPSSDVKTGLPDRGAREAPSCGRNAYFHPYRGACVQCQAVCTSAAEKKPEFCFNPATSCLKNCPEFFWTNTTNNCPSSREEQFRYVPLECCLNCTEFCHTVPSSSANFFQITNCPRVCPGLKPAVGNSTNWENEKKAEKDISELPTVKISFTYLAHAHTVRVKYIAAGENHTEGSIHSTVPKNITLTDTQPGDNATTNPSTSSSSSTSFSTSTSSSTLDNKHVIIIIVIAICGVILICAIYCLHPCDPTTRCRTSEKPAVVIEETHELTTRLLSAEEDIPHGRSPLDTTIITLEEADQDHIADPPETTRKTDILLLMEDDIPPGRNQSESIVKTFEEVPRPVTGDGGGQVTDGIGSNIFSSLCDSYQGKENKAVPCTDDVRCTEDVQGTDNVQGADYDSEHTDTMLPTINTID